MYSEGVHHVKNFQFENGAVYSGICSFLIFLGQMVGIIREGEGVQIWADGAKYEGFWKKNRANGEGIFFHADGDIYSGTWKEDKASGYGTYTHINGAKYEGQWEEDL